MATNSSVSKAPRLLSSRLWVLAAVLGVATIHLTMTIVHDTSRRRESVRTITRSLAEQVATGFATHLQLVETRYTRPLTADVALLRDAVFTPYLREVTAVNAQLVELDTASIQISNADSSIVLGALSKLHAYRATARGRGIIDGWTVTVALHPAQFPDEFVDPPGHDRLWLLGLIGIVTIAVIIAAIGSSQRELLLARTRSDFVAGVSHELRMPLAQILLASETIALRRERTDAERAGLSRSIVREARRLMGIVDNVLFFSRSDSARPHVHLQAVLVASLFDSVVESVDLAVVDAGQSIAVNAGADLSVLADADLARHALVNLVDNAIKYGKAAQQIVLSAERTHDNRVQLHVDDEGPGVPAGERTRVFGAYERLARDQVSERTGTGLGLAIVRRIAEACGGRVWIESSPAGGARVTLELGTAL